MAPLATTLRAVLLATTMVGGGAACSFVVESRDRQCESDDDCTGFEGAVCAEGACVPRASAGSAGCLGEDGCFSCPPTAQEEFLNACTTSECIPYDNGQLEGLLEPDGSLPAVP